MDAETAAMFPCKTIREKIGTIPVDWSAQPLGVLTVKIGSGATPKGGSTVYVDDGISFIRSQNIHDGEFRWDGLAHISSEAAVRLDGVTVERADVMLNITGDSILAKNI